jgi:acetolactate synthase-1/2/3 large subunit
MTVAEFYADFLAKKGCTHAFGIVGGANLALFCEISKRLQMICVAHEQAASLASLYHYRACGRIAPCLVTAGGGSSNALTGVVEAYMDSIPLLVISGNEMSKMFKNEHPRSIGFQGFNPVEAMSWCTKATVSVDNSFGAQLALDGLYRKAMQPRQGAVWVDVPQDIATSEA